MKVAISSGSFGQLFAVGELTQLEWLVTSAATLGADGVVFERAHFPRTDGEYLAQVKKVTVDLGLVPLAIDDPTLFAPDADPATIELAAGVGALFVITRLPPPGDVPPATFIATVAAAKRAVQLAKARNITLLAGTAPGTLASDVSDLRHLHKDVDSAWLQYLIPAGTEPAALRGRDRALVVTVDATDNPATVAEIDEAGRPWLLLRGAVDAERVRALRRVAARRVLAGAAVG